MKKYKFICPDCGSESIIFDAYGSLRWDKVKQDWEIIHAEPADNGEEYCINCDEYVVSEEVEIRKIKLSKLE